MKRYSKILLCAVLTTALLFSLAFSAFGASVSSSSYVFDAIYENSDKPMTYFFIRNSSGDFDSVYTSLLTDYNVGMFNFADYGLELDNPKYFPFSTPTQVKPFEYFYLNGGTVGTYGYSVSYKDFFTPETGSCCVYFEFMYGIGFQVVAGELIPFNTPYDFHLYVNGGIRDELGEFSVVERVSVPNFQAEATNGVTTYNLELMKIRFTFYEPFDVSTFADITVQLFSDWQVSPHNYALSVFNVYSPFDVFFVLYEDIPAYKEEQSVNKNNSSIGDINNQIGSINDKLEVSKPPDQNVDNILNSIDINKVGELGSLSGVNNPLHENFNRFVSLMCISVLGIAFIGYVLHGKRG